MVSLVFFAGGDAAADVPFCLVLLQNFLRLQIERAVVLGQPLTEILMYGWLSRKHFLKKSIPLRYAEGWKIRRGDC